MFDSFSANHKLFMLSNWFSDEGVYQTLTTSDSTQSRTKWNSIPTCLNLCRPLTRSVQEMEPRLSWNTCGGLPSRTLSSSGTMDNHLTSRMATDRALNSASTVDNAVQEWSLDVQIIGPPFMVIRNPVRDRCFDESLAQSASVQQFTSIFIEAFGIKMPKLAVPMRYLTTFSTSSNVLTTVPTETLRSSTRPLLCQDEYELTRITIHLALSETALLPSQQLRYPTVLLLIRVMGVPWVEDILSASR